MNKRGKVSAIVRYKDSFVFPSGTYGNIEILRGKDIKEIFEKAEQTAKENNTRIVSISE